MKTNYIKENIKELHVITLIAVSAICYFEVISELSFSIVGFGGWIFPWSFLILIFEGFFFPVIISFLMLSSVIYGLYASWKGGVQRVIGKYFILSVVGFVLANWLAVILYKSWSGVSISESPRMSYILFNGLPSHGIAFQHFMISFFASYALIILLLCGKLLAKKKYGKNVLGGAHFSSVFEAKKSGLFAEEGIVLGKAFGKTLKLPGFESVLVTAPTGGGKTTSIAIPNLIEWEGSGIFNDLKGELFEKTAQYRQRNLGNICFRFSPTDPKLKTHRYNPFYYVSENPNLRIRDLQLIAETLIPSERVDGGFWYTSSREIFLMLALYLFEKNGMATLSEIHDLSKEDNFFEWLKLETTSGEIKNTVFYQSAFSLLNSDPKSQKNILKDFHSRMILFVDPMVRHATSGNDFDLREMRKTKMSIYINIQDSDKQRLKPILTLFWAQFIHLMTEHEPDIEKEPYSVLALLDEFGNMASIEKLKEGMSFFRSYRIRAIVIVQYLAQIVSAYGQHGAKGFLNAKVKITFALNDMQDAQFFSESLGKKTIEVESHSSSRGKHASTSRNRSLQSHPLMTPDEIMRMSPDSEIILLEARPPLKAKKCPWYEDPYYRSLLDPEKPRRLAKTCYNATMNPLSRFTFKPAIESQRALIHTWLKQDYVAEWIHGQGLQNTLGGLDKFIQLQAQGKGLDRQSKITQHWVGYDGDVPFVYLLTSNVFKNTNDEYSKYSETDGLMITLDIFIVDSKYLGKGLAAGVIKEFLLSQFSDASEVFIDPEKKNERAVHVYQKVGFRIVGEFLASWYPVPHYIMKLDMKKHNSTGKL